MSSDGPRSTVGREVRGWTEGEESSQSACFLPLEEERERDRLTSSMASWSWVNLSMSLREERDECQLGGSGSSGGRPYVESSAGTDNWYQHV